ncbi:MAG TPA: VWA domain-containing protein [Anaerolineae bacterium]|nr:VWA domain-containing protein [Anaerolineae bacterium]
MTISFIYPTALWLLALALPLAGLALAGRRRPTRARFWAGLGIRLLLLASLVLALAGTQVRRPVDRLTVVFVVDASDSVPAGERERAEALVRQALQAMPPGDRAAVVVFGADALVERVASEEPTLADLTSVPVTTRTNVAEALQLAMALFPQEGAKRLVLLSDGRENVGQAIEQAELAAARGIQLTYIPLRGPEGQVEALLEALEAPGQARQGQTVELTAVVRSTARIGATLRVFADGALIESRQVTLQEGLNRFAVPVEAEEPGFRRLKAQIVPDRDTLLQNNEASAFTVVHGPPRVLLVEGLPGEAANLLSALLAASMRVEVVAPAQVPVTLPRLAGYDAVILANVPARALPEGAMEALRTAVRDLGRGLVMVGGENAYGAGGYLRTPLEEALPVDMDVRTKEQVPNVALVLAVDKSGSMGRCHCSGGGPIDRPYERVESGLPKVDIAKEAVMRAAAALGPQDYLGVVAFDEQARWALEVAQLANFLALERAIGGIRAEGGTNIYAGLAQAEESLREVDARVKHIILLTDGWSSRGGYEGLIQRMREEGITLSVVAAGGGSADYLADLAREGKGRYYPAANIQRVPDIFLRETVKAVGSYIIEEPFYPLLTASSPILAGLDPARLPPLLGYNGSTPKMTAWVVLSTPRGDPLLATWQYGLGRAVAWTSDMKGQWATAWLGWDGFARFAAQLVAWALPAPQEEGLRLEAELEGTTGVLRLEAIDRKGRPRQVEGAVARVVDPDLGAVEVPLRQVAPGRYEGRLPLSEPDVYLVQAAAGQGGKEVGAGTAGLVVPYSPEYREWGTDPARLAEWARTTGGASLAAPAEAFLHNLPAGEQAQEIWPALLLVAALLFPLDVGIRRVMLGPRDLRRAAVRMREWLPRRRVEAEEPLLGRLFQARERARRQTGRLEDGEAGRLEGWRARGQQDQSSNLPTSPDHGDSLARLREAKRRARRRVEGEKGE